MENETASRPVTMAVLARSGFEPGGDLVLIAEADEEDGVPCVGLNRLVGERPDIATDYVLSEGGRGAPDARRRACDRHRQRRREGDAARSRHRPRPGRARLDSEAGANAVPRLATLIGRLAGYRPARRLLPETRALLEALAGPSTATSTPPSPRHRRASGASRPRRPALRHDDHADPARELGGPQRHAPARQRRLRPPGPAWHERRRPARRVGAGARRRPPYEIAFPEPTTGGSLSPIDTPLYDACRRFVADNDPGAILLPTLCAGFTDSHHMHDAFGAVAYGFWPMRHTPYEIAADGSTATTSESTSTTSATPRASASRPAERSDPCAEWRFWQPGCRVGRLRSSRPGSGRKAR